MKPAKDPQPGLYIAKPDVHTLGSQDGSGGGEASLHLLQMGTVTPNGGCDVIPKL